MKFKERSRLLRPLWYLPFLCQHIFLQFVALGILHLECTADYSDCQPEHYPARRPLDEGCGRPRLEEARLDHTEEQQDTRDNRAGPTERGDSNDQHSGKVKDKNGKENSQGEADDHNQVLWIGYTETCHQCNARDVPYAASQDSNGCGIEGIGQHGQHKPTRDARGPSRRSGEKTSPKKRRDDLRTHDETNKKAPDHHEDAKEPVASKTEYCSDDQPCQADKESFSKHVISSCSG